MSLNIQPLKPIAIYDPRVMPSDYANSFPVVKSGSQVLYKQYQTNNISSSSIQFTCVPPSQNIYVDRNVSLRIPMRLKFVASGVTVNAGTPAGTLTLLNPGQCAVRSMPISKILETVQCTINNTTVSQSMSDMASALERYNIDEDLKTRNYSKSASYPSLSQKFHDLFGSVNSSLSLAVDSASGLQAFPFTIVEQTNDGAGNLTSTVDLVVTESLMLSPLYWGKFCEDHGSLWGVKTFDLQLNFIGGNGTPSRVFAIDKGVDPAPPGTSGVHYSVGSWNSTVEFSNFGAIPFSYPLESTPTAMFQYLTPSIVDKSVDMSKSLTYPYYQLERYPTDFGSAMAPGVSQDLISNNLQLNSIPSRVYVYARRNNNDMQATPFHPDSFLRINSLDVQWGNRNSIFSSAGLQQLYDVSLANGLNMTWAQWSGTKVNKPTLGLVGAGVGFGSAAQQYSGSGSVICFTPAQVGLNAYEAPGLLDHLMLQIRVNCTNIADEAFAPTLYVVAVSTGTFSIFNGQSSLQIGVITKENVLKADEQGRKHMMSYCEATRIMGGNYMCALKERIVDLYRPRQHRPKKLAGGAAITKRDLKDRLMN